MTAPTTTRRLALATAALATVLTGCGAASPSPTRPADGPTRVSGGASGGPTETSPCPKRPDGAMIDDTERARGCPGEPQRPGGR